MGRAREAASPRQGRKGGAGEEPPGLGQRRGALMLLSGVLDRGQMLEEGVLGDLAPAERAAAHSLADLALRRLADIDAALAVFVADPPPAPGVHILRVMAAEVLFGGTAPHAAVDMAVRLARATPPAARLAGLVNAVGRRLTTSPPAERRGAAGIRNAAPWLLERLRADWGRAEAETILEGHLTPPPHDLTLQREDDGPALAAEVEGMLLPSGSLRLPGRPQISALPGYADGAWWVQDAAAALPARLLEVAPGERVLDLCAAPGGKTLQLAAAGAAVTALDLSARRMERLRENLARTGLTAELVVADALTWQPEAPFDAVLLDAPCSATGTARRHPDLPYRFDPESLGALSDLQAALLDSTWRWVKPGGRLVYATCSLLKAEGEAQAEAFLARTPDAARVALKAVDPALPPNAVTDSGDLRTLPSMLPQIGGLDGFFACRLRRAA
ncbi:MAG: RsmB/NOP family class I SAM-dependent RNA methyltransferase [Pseudomonadota bacterium]